MMKLQWSKSVGGENPWEPECFGVFSERNGLVVFFFLERNKLYAITENCNLVRINCAVAAGEVLPLPRKWIVTEIEGTPYLCLSAKYMINLQSYEVNDQPEKAEDAYCAAAKSEDYYVYAPFQLGDYRIEHKGECGYLCRKDGQIIWKFNGRAYLYTEILRWKDSIFFGTAGNGGYFYVLGIEDGAVLTAIKTGGTTSIVREKHLCYVLSNDKKAKLLCIDLRDGKVIQEVDLPGKATMNSRLQLLNGKLHAVTFVYRKHVLESVMWNCVEI